jgi:protein-L-isoaspartate(D-aspartate) O-methyltransferase
MVEAQIARRGVASGRVLAAMRNIRREDFVDAGFEEFAYVDSALPIGEGQTISQPYIVARTAEAAEIEADDRVLEIGTGSGYGAAILSRLAGRVFTMERFVSLADRASERLRNLGLTNVEVRVGDGTLGLPEEAPFDAIVVTASGPSIPVALQEQLDIGARLIIPVGSGGDERLLRITRIGPGKFEDDDLGAVRFVPLIGEQGWPDPDRTRSTADGIHATRISS